MNKLSIPIGITLAVIALAFATGISAQESKPKSSQQQKFADCAHQSKGLKGDEHKQFMSECLAGKTHEMKTDAAAKASADKGEMKHKTKAQNAKMKACKAEAKSKDLTGDEAKTFMSECMQEDDK